MTTPPPPGETPRTDRLREAADKALRFISKAGRVHEHWKETTDVCDALRAALAAQSEDQPLIAAVLHAQLDEALKRNTHLQAHHDYILNKMTKRIGVLQDALNEIYHQTSTTDRQTEIINEALHPDET